MSEYRGFGGPHWMSANSCHGLQGGVVLTPILTPTQTNGHGQRRTDTGDEFWNCLRARTSATDDEHVEPSF
jgi:hypothetical protein